MKAALPGENGLLDRVELRGLEPLTPTPPRRLVGTADIRLDSFPPRPGARTVKSERSGTTVNAVVRPPEWHHGWRCVGYE
jgi:hypothetical protein